MFLRVRGALEVPLILKYSFHWFDAQINDLILLIYFGPIKFDLSHHKTNKISSYNSGKSLPPKFSHKGIWNKTKWMYMYKGNIYQSEKGIYNMYKEIGSRIISIGTRYNVRPF